MKVFPMYNSFKKTVYSYFVEIVVRDSANIIPIRSGPVSFNIPSSSSSFQSTASREPVP